LGYDIHGWVEVKPRWYDRAKNARWDGIVKIDRLIPRAYDPFACLFGVGNWAHFRPIAAGRNLPSDVSEEAERDYLSWFDDNDRDPSASTEGSNQERSATDSVGGETWITWAELQTVDWDERAEAVDDRIHWYERDTNGHLVFKGKASYDRTFAQHVGRSVAETLANPLPFPDGSEWEIGERIYRAETLRRRDALTPDWQMLFSLMETVARKYGDESVRLVVWFDG
jgi:hypothetical protein